MFLTLPRAPRVLSAKLRDEDAQCSEKTERSEKSDSSLSKLHVHPLKLRRLGVGGCPVVEGSSGQCRGTVPKPKNNRSEDHAFPRWKTASSHKPSVRTLIRSLRKDPTCLKKKRKCGV